jgi:hypothetical protein
MIDKDKQVPFTAWRLMPSFRPAEVTLVKSDNYWSRVGYEDANRKWFPCGELWETKAEAIAEGRRRLSDLQERIDRNQKSVDKRKAALDKAEDA